MFIIEISYNFLYVWNCMELYDKKFLIYGNCMIRSFGQPGQSVFSTMYISEQIHVILYQYRDILPKIENELEKDKPFQFLDICFNKLHGALGNHEEVAFAVKKTADQLKFNGRPDDAIDYYSRAFKMYQLFGPEIEIQQVILLKEWTDCLPSNEAREKLQLAKSILEENF